MRNTIFTLAALCALGASAEEKAFTYVDDTAPVEYIGNNKAETYNVAVRLYQAGFRGYEIAGISVPVGEGVEMLEPQIWLSSELNAETVDGVKHNVADIATVEAAIVERDGPRWLEGRFAEPVVIPEGGLYAGYTFTIGEKTEANANPVAGMKVATEGGFYYFTTRSALKWKDYTKEKTFTSALRVILEGEFPAAGVSPVNAGKTYFAATADDMTLSVLLSQFGDEPIQSVAYTLVAGDKTATGEIEFDSPLSLQFGHGIDYDLTADIQLPAGDYPMSFTVDRVNGQPNGSVAPQFEEDVKFLTYYPVNRPLLEEFTGLWCGYCPRGWAAMNMLKEMYGDLYVCASYHLDPYEMDYDPMAIMGSMDVATPVAGYPNMYVNRRIEADPFWGPYPFAGGFAMPATWEDQHEQFTPWWIDASAAWTTEGRIEVNTGIVNAFSDATGKYRLLYMLVEDDMHSPEWKQQNNFFGEAGWEEYPYMKQFVETDGAVADLRYDDVIVYCQDVWGIAGSLPEEITADRLYEHTYTINPADVVNINGENLIFDSEKLKMIVVLLGSDGEEVLNSIMVPVTGGNGICAPDVERGEIVSVKYYDISGNEVGPEAKGIVIRRAVDANGNVATSKVMRR